MAPMAAPRQTGGVKAASFSLHPLILVTRALRWQGDYESDGNCLPCLASCLTCDLSAGNCTSCASTSYYHALPGPNAGVCVTQCPKGTYVSSVRSRSRRAALPSPTPIALCVWPNTVPLTHPR